MSVAFETNSNSSNNNNNNNNNNRIQFSHGMWIYNLPTDLTLNPWSSSLPAVKEEEDSTASSSIGNNSDADSDDDGEVQSKDSNINNNDGFVNGLNDLEQVLPIKRGISTFYAGKSKSYGSLADAVSAPSIQDIVKPEDAYSRKRKNMLAHHVFLDKNRESTTDNGISKRFARNGNEGAGRSVAMPGRSLPPLPRNGRMVTAKESSPKMYMNSPWRSLSLSDLQHASSLSSKGNEVDGH